MLRNFFENPNDEIIEYDHLKRRKYIFSERCRNILKFRGKRSDGTSEKNNADKEQWNTKEKKEIFEIYSRRTQGSLEKYRSENKIEKYRDYEKRKPDGEDEENTRDARNVLNKRKNRPSFKSEKSKNIFHIEYRHNGNSSSKHSCEESSCIQDGIIEI